MIDEYTCPKKNICILRGILQRSKSMYIIYSVQWSMSVYITTLQVNPLIRQSSCGNTFRSVDEDRHLTTLERPVSTLPFWLYREPKTLPCASHRAHGKDSMLSRATSPAHGILETLRIKDLHCALNYKHTAKSISLPCAEAKPSAKEKYARHPYSLPCAPCRRTAKGWRRWWASAAVKYLPCASRGTRQSLVSLPWASTWAHGKHSLCRVPCSSTWQTS